MYFDLKNVAISMLLIGAVAGTWYLGRVGEVVTTVSTPDVAAPLGYYLKNAVLLGTDAEGRVFYTVRAERVSEHGEGTALALERVRVEYRDSENVNWQVSAARASADRGQAVLELFGDVRLTSAAEAGAATTVIETERLRLEPDNYLASTSEVVAVSFGRHELGARGMEAYLKDDRLDLKSQVHGRFRN